MTLSQSGEFWSATLGKQEKAKSNPQTSVQRTLRFALTAFHEPRVQTPERREKHFCQREGGNGEEKQESPDFPQRQLRGPIRRAVPGEGRTKSVARSAPFSGAPREAPPNFVPGRSVPGLSGCRGKFRDEARFRSPAREKGGHAGRGQQMWITCRRGDEPRKHRTDVTTFPATGCAKRRDRATRSSSAPSGCSPRVQSLSEYD